MKSNPRKTERVAQNDQYIKDLIIKNSDYNIKDDGTIWTCLSRNGAGYIPEGKWRRLDTIASDGYRVVNITIKKGSREINKKDRKNYRRELRVNRIIFQKFVGNLDPNMVIDHINNNKEQNHPDNLQQITNEENTTKSNRTQEKYG